jgi:hypothetical protein
MAEAASAMRMVFMVFISLFDGDPGRWPVSLEPAGRFVLP